ncbi:hypothetical protein [Algoriphagus sp. Y33]|nr:hypothetical protein [Algoriphagus sp. Y33]
MNTKKVYYFLILLGVIYTIILTFSDGNEEHKKPEKTTLTIKTNLIEP